MKANQLLFTCEHASYALPKRYQALFPPAVELANAHWAYDIGAYKIFNYLCKHFKVSNQFHGKVSRLLVDLNRSRSHRQLFATAVAQLPASEKQQILESYYVPYYQALQTFLDKHTKTQRIIHIAVHSFTPVLNGVTRHADIGILYDPKRQQESKLAKKWQSQLRNEFHVRRNYPYRGSADGLATQLRRQFAQTAYLGFEIECNQALLSIPQQVQRVQRSLAFCLATLAPNFLC